MIEWLNKRFDEHEKASDDKRDVVADAENVYGEVWKAVQKVVQEANTRHAGLTLNGYPLKYNVLMGSRKLSITLAEDKCSIIAQPSDASPVTLSIRVWGDGTVCIKNNGEPLSYADAARAIMEPFLFEGQSPFAAPVLSGTD
jgi:hypothetical protein